LLGLVRKARGLTLSALASRLGVSKANVIRIEHGRDLRVSTLLDIARELGLEPMLIPKENVPAVRALLADLQPAADGDAAIDAGPRFG